MVDLVKINSELLPYLGQIAEKESSYDLNGSNYSFLERRVHLLSDNIITLGIISDNIVRSILQVSYTSSEKYNKYCSGLLPEKKLLQPSARDSLNCLYFSFAYFANSRDGGILVEKLLQQLQFLNFYPIDFAFSIVSPHHSAKHLNRFGFNEVLFDLSSFNKVYRRDKFDWAKRFANYNVKDFIRASVQS